MADSYKIGQERTADGAATLLCIDGELDINARDDLRAAILGAVDRGDVVVDLGGTTFLDSEALGALIDGYNAAVSGGTGFRVIKATGVVARVLGVSGAGELFGS
ncbi:STAS domain-containing protein [Paractinoplanes atraurantiacus]|uniref:Anti-sigma B factor antagonist n=1 Tax=Paractinoplanes atraurantiacus TaxID=1036182 RepID=A0A285JNS2_9ACTN|nr:STAS domain-containing protein [Actinoplanes atraurantiacus]SNY61723.1 anti-sigma B factor antagonist [Actinoplanes atraurantiacus]